MSKVNYNRIYKQHFNIEFDSSFVVHHIDGNHENNSIENLLLLPRVLHSRYHSLKNIVNNHRLTTTITGNQANQNNYYISYYEDFINVLNKCNKWYDYRQYLDGKLPNIHGIKLR